MELSDRLGEGVLHKAARSTHPGSLSLLPTLFERIKRSKRGLNCRDKRSFTPLMHCRVREAAQTLISFGADPTLPNSEGRDAIALASGRGDVEVLKTLLFSNCRVILPHSNPIPKRNPLIEAVVNRQAACIPLLVEYGIDINQCSHYHAGSTALMLAVRNEDEACVRALLQHSPKIPTNDDLFNSVAVYACLGNEVILDMLIAADAKAFRTPTLNNMTVLESGVRFILSLPSQVERKKYAANLLRSAPKLISIGVPITRKFLEELSSVHGSHPKLESPFSSFLIADIQSERLFCRFDSTPHDVKFLLSNGETSWCHLTALRIVSKYFEKYSNSKLPLVVNMEQYHLLDFEVVKHFLYTNTLLRRRDYLNVLSIAKKLEIARLCYLCGMSSSSMSHEKKYFCKFECDVYNTSAPASGEQCMMAPFLVGDVIEDLKSSPKHIKTANPKQSLPLESDRSWQIHTRINALRNGPHDIILQCEDIDVPVHSFFINEGKFSAMIHYHRALQQSPAGVVIPIVDMTYVQLRDVVTFFYIGRIESADLSSCQGNDFVVTYVLELFEISVYYLIHDLRRMCEHYLNRAACSHAAIAYQVFERAVALNCEQLAIDVVHRFLLRIDQTNRVALTVEEKTAIMEMLQYLLHS